MTIKPWSSTLQATATNCFGPSGGAVFAGVYELPDDIDAVQLVFANAGTTPYGIKGVTVSPSSTYGKSFYNLGGVTPYDQSGATIDSTLPVTFNGGGSYVLPWPPAMATFNGTYYNHNLSVISGALGANAVASARSILVSSTYGGATPVAGSFISDGLGGFASGTRISSVVAVQRGYRLTLSTATVGPLKAGQSVWITPAQPVLGATVPASTNPPVRTLTFSDWVPVTSLPRLDGGMAQGMGVAGGGAAAGTTVASVTPTSVNLSKPTTGATVPGDAVTFSIATTASIARPANAFRIDVASTMGLRKGQTVVHAAVPPGTTVTYVGKGHVMISAALTARTAAGDAVSFTQVAYTNNTTALAAGQTSLPFLSTSGRPLLLVRYQAVNGATLWAYAQLPSTVVGEQNLGFPEVRRNYIGGQSSGTALDAVNFSNSIGNQFSAAPTPYDPVYAINIHTLHRGVTILMAGDSHLEGFDTVTASANFVRLAAAQASTPQTPVTVINEAFSGKNLNVYGPNAALWLNTTKPGIFAIQTSTANGGDTLQGYWSGVARLTDLAQSYGGRPILITNLPAGARQALTFKTATDVVNGTVLTLDSYLSGLVQPGTFLLTGPTLPPAGVMATVAPGEQYGNKITLASLMTLPKGTVVSFGKLVVASGTSNSAGVTFTTPLPFFWTPAITPPAGCAATAFVTPTIATGQTLNAPCTLSADDVVKLGGSYPNPTYVPNTAIDRARTLDMSNGALAVFDAYGPAEDPNDPGFWLPGYSLDSVHGDDAFMAVEAAAFLPTLQQVIGDRADSAPP